ncbi:hypothetical protein V490_09369 [Pseudogymnoascus sp. VKM F-3557]|nr:hypothetical protein V490_09369 [Pseudogymnoascus sp. VKM F-3557]
MSVREQEARRYITPTTLWDLAEEILRPVSYAGIERIDEKFFEYRCADDASKFATKSLLVEILAGIRLDVLQGVILGDLPERARENLAVHFENETRIGDGIPGIYTNYIVDEEGRPPTCSDIGEILEVMESYVKRDDDQLAQYIDGLYGTNRQLWKYANKKSYRDAHTTFIAFMRDRISSTSDNTDEEQPLKGGISEVGFSITPYKRIRDHKCHVLSTCIMNLFEACAQYSFPEKYSVEGYVVTRTVNPLAVALSEVAVSRIACSYSDHGNGFNYHRAGASVHGLNNRPIISATDQTAWATLQANQDMGGVEDEIARIKECTQAEWKRLEEQLRDEDVAFDQANAADEEHVELLRAEVDLQKREEARAEEWRRFEEEMEGDDNRWLQEMAELCDLK